MQIEYVALGVSFVACVLALTGIWLAQRRQRVVVHEHPPAPHLHRWVNIERIHFRDYQVIALVDRCTDCGDVRQTHVGHKS